MLDYRLEFEFHCQWCQGWPMISISIDDLPVCDHAFSQETEFLTIAFPRANGPRKLSIVRHGKDTDNVMTDHDGIIVKDQTLEIRSVKINGSRIPDHIFDQHSQFSFNDQIHQGSRYFGPNGTWTFNMIDPLITWILDEKIQHESKYNNDYIYPWAYKFGPNSVEQILHKITATRQKVMALDL